MYFQTAPGRGDTRIPFVRATAGYESRGHGADEVKISCLRSFPRDTISRFLNHVGSARAREENRTLVFTVDTLYSSRSTRECWRSRSKPSRKLSTIDIEEEIKTDLLTDVDRFVDPLREHRDADRGIPYLRGYLFYGPPGKGKSSMAFALAGHLRTALYKTTVSDINDEMHLYALFSQPERGDIILLEDIDSADIDQEARKEKDSKNGGRISKASLLYAIDSIRKEGVIVIMSANSSELLDEALVRDGRIDRKFRFGYVCAPVIQSIFMRMYCESQGQAVTRQVAIAKLAREFSSKFAPELEFTPAEIQGFLARHPNPEKALLEVETWIEAQVQIATF